MLKMIKQARAAFSLLNPGEVRNRARRPLNFGLVAAGGRGYAEMEDFLLPVGMEREQRMELMERIHRAGDANAPSTVDLVLYQDGIPSNNGAYTFRPHDPQSTISQILEENDDLALPLARQF